MKATIHIESPVIACRRILGLPCLVRTVASLVKEGVTQIILEGPDGGVIHPLMKKYGWSRFVRQTHAKSALDKEGLRLKAEYHYDPDLVKWLVSSNAQRFDDEAGEMPENWWQKLDVGQQSLAKAEQKLLKNIRHKTEGWVAPNINKPISFWITKQLVKTSLTPNQITLANLFLAAVASLFIALPNYGLRFVGAILMYLTSIIDGCDGEVASLKCLGTRFGAWFDTVADDVANNLFFIGLFYGLYIFSGDVLFDKRLFDKLRESSKENLLVVDRDKQKLNKEAVKVVLDPLTQRVIHIGKEIDLTEADGEYIGLAKFSSAWSQALSREFEKRFSGVSVDDYYYEDIIDCLLKKNPPTDILPTANYIWSEVDTMEDLEEVKKIFSFRPRGPKGRSQGCQPLEKKTKRD